ncbi:bifunctional phosphopantothenoylcysteine decarboxylase/phosphopantothenate--cysteine ligase CoaBC [Paralimibaculum aggregatum]|uniref:Coenzyme A biosynthesis bifunctional protein CoaBC n=1 Tax=Paralimibaculum aggregatum TaxID=3036245 RepID=A0ABQ6LPT8_9RHOB|nr:bifunctional phosphopantothenoylcysteine decarboxylase/phosphopantothenate--cysteine ligase CoaBC [Limibaculum sp. NKW23]GMG82958.1 bifunctional phosphopantothenoylcysteine decarboxylase/phosphopantothenate--cysteine ligase CoaBC [Limibaculum sp. NKW23]
MQAKRILLIIGGGIAAYKSLELIRLIAKAGGSTTPVLTGAAREFVTPLSAAALSGNRVHEALFDLTDEAEMGHIELSRAADLVVVAPATADLMARMAQGRADDLASTLLLATDTPILIAPAMNLRMWLHPATQRNLAVLRGDGVAVVGPNEGDMACGEHGPGRMAEPAEILAAIEARLADPARPPHLVLPGEAVPGPLAGKRVLVTSGPTHEPIDPVRYIANRSSGAQGTAVAAALRDLGAEVRFVTGPADTPPPEGVTVIPVESAAEMLAAVEKALPVDAAVFAAAVADWRVASASSSKIKKDGGGPPALALAENPDILKTVSHLADGRRPSLVVGFAAETDDVVTLATAKRLRKGCDWIVANDVRPETGIMGGAENAVTLITADGAETWPRAPKAEVARRLAARIAAAFAPAMEADR